MREIDPETGFTTCCGAVTTYTGEGDHVCKGCFEIIPVEGPVTVVTMPKGPTNH